MIEWLKNFGFSQPTQSEESEPDPFLETLNEKGEVYIKNDEGWKVVMYGNDGEIFFEQ